MMLFFHSFQASVTFRHLFLGLQKTSWLCASRVRLEHIKLIWCGVRTCPLIYPHGFRTSVAQFPRCSIAIFSASWVDTCEELIIGPNTGCWKSMTNPIQTERVLTAGRLAFVVWPIRADDLCTKDLDVKMLLVPDPEIPVDGRFMTAT